MSHILLALNFPDSNPIFRKTHTDYDDKAENRSIFRKNIYAPQKSSIDAGAAAAAAVVHNQLVTLTCARQQTNTPNTHITLLQFTTFVAYVDLTGLY